ncbi:MAG: hypothetical protein KKD63_15590 [Proteobacteria bacterium]|nr:hypothetical protein [Desulfobulbaceae bacterium]MBU4154292.1 hypothetical protein [Pseudomonadota bacterium]MDP2105402.1 hypothetical protein [Desulfobulbaceae bacterium]
MNTTETTRGMSAEKKTALCIVMSMFYFAMLAYPFGVAMEGYVWQKALIAGVIFFAISIPAWIVNLKREFYDATAAEETVEMMLEKELDLSTPGSASQVSRIGELARLQKWLSLEDIAQILFCQGGECGSRFGQIAIKRNYLTPQQVDLLLSMQKATG